MASLKIGRPLASRRRFLKELRTLRTSALMNCVPGVIMDSLDEEKQRGAADDDGYEKSRALKQVGRENISLPSTLCTLL